MGKNEEDITVNQRNQMADVQKQYVSIENKENRKIKKKQKRKRRDGSTGRKKENARQEE